MKMTIFARVVAKPINFPDVIEMSYHCLDEHQNLTGRRYGAVRFPWDEVQRRFRIDVNYAKECEQYFQNGESVFLGNREVIIEADE